jgi:hypothetical protein
VLRPNGLRSKQKEEACNDQQAHFAWRYGETVSRRRTSLYNSANARKLHLWIQITHTPTHVASTDEMNNPWIADNEALDTQKTLLHLGKFNANHMPPSFGGKLQNLK